MTDTVKLIIEIPKGKELIDKAIWYDVSDFDTEDLAIILTALKNGVPLDDVKALEQEPCGDAISRDAVEEIINDIRDCISVEGYWAILEKLKKLPPVTPKIQMIQNPCVECGCNYCTNDDCENRYIVDIQESEE